jgi:hypothetical protein
LGARGDVGDSELALGLRRRQHAVGRVD